MGCVGSKESDITAVTTRGTEASYDEQAEDAAALLSGAGALYTRLQLSIACKDLVNMDKFSKSDPCVVVKLHSPAEGSRPREIGRTEIISNNLDPKFVTLVPVTFKFEEVQTLRFEVYDVDSAFSSADASGVDMNQQDFQGAAECALAQIVGARAQTWEGTLEGVSKARRATPSKVIVRAEEVADSSMLVDLSIAGSNLRHGSLFLLMSQVGESGPPRPCYKTEIVKGSPPKPWKAIKVPLQVLANGDPYRPLLLEVFSWKSGGAHTPLGSCKTSVHDLQEKAGIEGGLPLDKGQGKLTVRGCTLTPVPSFFDFIAGGMQIDFTVAIDYTGSNGDPSHPSSLHYHDPNGLALNQYAQAIQAVGGVLEFFDDDRRFPVYGFGGCPRPRAPANHCFAVNGRDDQPEVDGIAGVLAVYRESLRHVTLSGPTLFAPVISQAAALAASSASTDPNNQAYTILLLITDGAICDMANTVDAIVAAADYPFSIVIVGVGDADYASMDALDGDEIRLQNSAGQYASRDIVQFVPMRDFKGKSSHELAKAVLREIPGQVIQYMNANNIVPGDPRRHGAGGRQGSIGSNVIKGSFMHDPAAPGNPYNAPPPQDASYMHHGPPPGQSMNAGGYSPTYQPQPPLNEPLSYQEGAGGYASRFAPVSHENQHYAGGTAPDAPPAYSVD